ncbi:MAG: DNA translocase FtsK 4TM domain-containing protein [Nitrospirae bacterium]|nr:DNA translocase FtsK 4TM domain-containing protein [Nitrospirota bacterium]
MEEKGSRIKDEIIGVLAIAAGLVVVISLISHNQWDQSFFTHNTSELKNLLGRFGANLSEMLLQVIGLSSYIIPAILILFGVRKVFGWAVNQRSVLIIVTFIALMISASSLLTLFLGSHSGGAVGILATEFTNRIISSLGSLLLFATLTLVCLMYIIQFSVADLARKAKSKVIFGAQTISAMKAKREEEKEHPQIKEEAAVPVMPTQPEIAEEPAVMEMPEIPEIQEELPLIAPDEGARPSKKSISKQAEKISGDYTLPGVDLLKDPPPSKSRPTKEELLQQSELLEKKLQDYSIEGKVTYVSPGPVVTMFEFEPAPGIKINKIMSLADDLAMAMKAHSIRISPIHGRSTLGIEVPNQERDDVFLKDLIVSDSSKKSPSKLTIALGKDIFGTPVSADLSKMPHLLIAGATGSGKSVGMNSIVLSLLFRASPKELKMLMIDPKMLELSAYSEIPHLLMPVITLPKEATNALKLLVFEMERRYRLLAESGARNIEAYNSKVASRTYHKAAEDSISREPLPYIVIFIDELADLMFASGHEVEDSIARLAQMARAAGIHLILATQRPSVDVITGIIKANFPSRISFQVSSKLDSRIILDTYGADQLLGKGDMLFVSPGKKIKRIHGAYVSEDEIRDVVDFIRAQGGPDYTLFEDISIGSQEESARLDDDKDDLYLQARDIVLSTGQASISYIQRRMKIGYNRAARIMEMLEEEGVVGPPGEAGKPREILWRKK